eukprot:5400829-Pleurochrysis_carterae.AAC.1
MFPQSIICRVELIIGNHVITITVVTGGGREHAVNVLDGVMMRLCSLSVDGDARLCLLRLMGGRKREGREGVAIRVHLRSGACPPVAVVMGA